MSAGFTPGPWEVGEFRLDGYPIDAQHHYSVGWAYDINGLPANQANARLIAAAPELYEALEICLAMGERELKKALNLSGQSPYDIGIAAIRKARGEQ